MDQKYQLFSDVFVVWKMAQKLKYASGVTVLASACLHATEVRGVCVFFNIPSHWKCSVSYRGIKWSVVWYLAVSEVLLLQDQEQLSCSCN